MQFECVQCGNCCRQRGALRFLRSDVERISDYLGLTFEEFCDRYDVTTLQNELYFIETSGDCIFLDDENRCSVHEVKPFFCSNYIPFVDNPGTPIYGLCQGIGQGKNWTKGEIKKRYDAMLDKFIIIKGGEA